MVKELLDKKCCRTLIGLSEGGRTGHGGERTQAGPALQEGGLILGHIWEPGTLGIQPPRQRRQEMGTVGHTGHVTVLPVSVIVANPENGKWRVCF